MSSAPFVLKEIPHFRRALKKIYRKHRDQIKRIEKMLWVLSQDPYNNSEQLKGEHDGKKKTRVGDFRITSAICEECRRLGHVKKNRCADCAEQRDNTVKLFDIGLRPRAYR